MTRSVALVFMVAAASALGGALPFAQGAADHGASNVAFFLDLLGWDTPPAGEHTITVNGVPRTMTGDAAFAFVGAASKDTDLRRAAAVAAEPAPTAGDLVWLGLWCDLDHSGVVHRYEVAATDQVHTRQGDAHLRGVCLNAFVHNWTLKSTHTFPDGSAPAVAGAGFTVSFFTLTYGAMTGVVAASTLPLGT